MYPCTSLCKLFSNKHGSRQWPPGRPYSSCPFPYLREGYTAYICIPSVYLLEDILEAQVPYQRCMPMCLNHGFGKTRQATHVLGQATMSLLNSDRSSSTLLYVYIYMILTYTSVYIIVNAIRSLFACLFRGLVPSIQDEFRMIRVPRLSLPHMIRAQYTKLHPMRMTRRI